MLPAATMVPMSSDQVRSAGSSPFHGCLKAVRPAAVDSHTGVEGPGGEKSPELVARFCAKRSADSEENDFYFGWPLSDLLPGKEGGLVAP